MWAAILSCTDTSSLQYVMSSSDTRLAWSAGHRAHAQSSFTYHFKGMVGQAWWAREGVVRRWNWLHWLIERVRMKNESTALGHSECTCALCPALETSRASLDDITHSRLTASVRDKVAAHTAFQCVWSCILITKRDLSHLQYASKGLTICLWLAINSF